MHQHNLTKRYLYPCFPLILLAWLNFASAQETDPGEIFDANCAACHVTGAEQDEKIPPLSELQTKTANAILRSLTDGAMRLQGNALTNEQRMGIAEYLSGGMVINQPITFETGMCPDIPTIDDANIDRGWSGWGLDEKNSRYQTNGGLTAADIPRLNLKWAFAIPDISQARSAPAIYGDRLFMGSLEGVVFSLNASTGCTYWSFKTEAGVRGAISVADIDVAGTTRTAIFFTDQQANAYAVDAETGEEIWRHKVDDHPAALGTGSLTYYEGVLYIPLSGLPEESSAPQAPTYDCCTFRGSVTALDATTGEQRWQTFMLPDPQPVQELENGKTLYGPAGVGIWNSPTIDAKRGLLYVTTGNAYVGPKMETSNAVVALDVANGDYVWVNQVLPGDIWSGGCFPGLGGDPDTPGCPEDLGPDFDFSASPVLVTGPDGKDIIVATQKSGEGHAFDPDNNGEKLWTYRWGVGAAAGGVYGTTSDGEKAYFAVADFGTEAPGGLHAVDLQSGERVWFTPPGDLFCNPAVMGCSPVMSGALTAIPGAIVAGSADGGLRAYTTDTGDMIWSYNTNRDFDTVNGLPATGGSVDGPAAIVANGMLYVSSGNGGFFGMPGNVLLAFSINGE